MTNEVNKAWAEFNTPLSQDTLRDFCYKIEQLFRINPYLEITTWESLEKDKYFVELVNHSQEPEFRLQTNLSVTQLEKGLQIDYEDGIKSSTSFHTKPMHDGSKLVITEHYHSESSDEYKNKFNEVDKSLAKWAEDLQTYLIDMHRWSWFPPWRIYKHKIWLPMKPAGRRVTYMLIWVSFIEIALIALGGNCLLFRIPLTKAIW